MAPMPDLNGVDPAYQRQRRTRLFALAEIAEKQWGVVSAHQLAELGIGRGAVAHWLSSGRLHSVHRRVYAVGHRRLTRNSRLWAAVLAAGDDAVLSHRSAAALHGLRA